MTKELNFAIKLARQAGAVLTANFQKASVVKTKAGGLDFALDADLKSEELIIKQIKKFYPSYSIISEEAGFIEGESSHVWIIDPLDGTKFYQAGIKFFAVSIALWQGNLPLLGVVYQPFLNDVYLAQKGRGAFLNGKKIKVSAVDSLKRSRISITTSPSGELDVEAFKKSKRQLISIYDNFYRLHTADISSLSCCWVAQGLMAAHFDLIGREKIWDVAAGIVIAKEAGAEITGLDGKFHGQDTGHIVITNGIVHKDFLKLLSC